MRKKYEKLLENEDGNGVIEAFKNREIDFSYMPKKKRFYRLFLILILTKVMLLLKILWIWFVWGNGTANV